MKKAIITGLLFLLIIMPAQAKSKTYVVTSSQPISSSSTDNLSDYFSIGQRIFYGVKSAKGFKDTALKIQVIKKEDNAPNGVYSMAYAKTVSIPYGENFYTDYIILRTPGYYVLRVFEVKDLEKALYSCGLWVK